MNLFLKALIGGFYKIAGLDSPWSNHNYGSNWSKQREKCLKRMSTAVGFVKHIKMKLVGNRLFIISHHEVAIQMTSGEISIS